jgi:hypothetical protein
MSAYTEHAAGLAELQTELGDDCPAIVYAGATVKILPGAAANGSRNSVGGLSLESDLIFTALLADFPSTPASNKSFTYEGKPYKIETVTFGPGRVQVEINANDAAQGL